jgi:hypothetical protein
MRRPRFGLTLAGLLFLFALTATFLTGPTSVYANTLTEGAGHDLPYYARIEGTEEPFHDEIWAPIAFYRPPECIPNDFNLLDFYDFELAYGCEPPTTDGFMLWEGEPYLSNPQLIKLYGLVRCRCGLWSGPCCKMPSLMVCCSLGSWKICQNWSVRPTFTMRYCTQV